MAGNPVPLNNMPVICHASNRDLKKYLDHSVWRLPIRCSTMASTIRCMISILASWIRSWTWTLTYPTYEAFIESVGLLVRLRWLFCVSGDARVGNMYGIICTSASTEMDVSLTTADNHYLFILFSLSQPSWSTFQLSFANWRESCGINAWEKYWAKDLW